ncbi:MAG: glycosyltransferase family 4 protein [Caldilineaceae bacterium]
MMEQKIVRNPARLATGIRWLKHPLRNTRSLLAYGVFRKVRADWFGFRNYLRYRTLSRSDQACTKTILVMDNRVLRPQDSTLGRTNDVYNRLLQQRGLRVFLMPYAPGWDKLHDGPHGAHWDEPYALQLRQQGFVVLAGWFFQRRRQAWLRRNAAAVDYLLVRFPDAAAYLPWFSAHSTAKKLYLAADLAAVRKEREYTVTSDPLTQQSAQRFAAMEDEIFRSADALLTFSHEEADWLRQHYGAKVFHLPLFAYAELPNPQPTLPTGQTLLFIGNFDYTANPDGLHWFVQTCLPLLVEECPTVKVLVIGNAIPAAIQALQSQHVAVLGKVSDQQLTTLYGQARVVIAPLRFGAGVKGKVIEALAHGVPVVTTRFGVEGVPGLDELIPPTDTPAAMVAAISHLLTDDAAWQHASTRGQAFVRQHFSMQAAQMSLEALFAWLERGA